MSFNNKRDDLVASLDHTLDAAITGRSPWLDARARFLRNKAAVFSVVLLCLIALACIVGPRARRVPS